MKANRIISLASIAILGMSSIILPVFFIDDLKQYDSPLFPLIKTGIEGLSKYSIISLFFSGFIVKLFSDEPSWKIGLMSMILFPLAAICEIIADTSSHKMFPFEFILYAFFTIPPIIGAYTSQLIKKIFIKKK